MSDRKDGGPVARPILMNGDMVRAVLDGRKTQTRRVLKLPKGCFWVYDDLGTDGMWTDSNLDHGIWHAEEVACPYGQPGDLLYVRETFARWPTTDGSSDLMYKADDDPDYDDIDNWGVRMFNWTPSIHMPRWASRITLEITDVRVERLRDISDEGCMAEGIQCCPTEGRFKCSPSGGYAMPWRSKFAQLWESIYGAESWDANPWVWVVEFKPHLKNVDALLSEREGSQ